MPGTPPTPATTKTTTTKATTPPPPNEAVKISRASHTPPSPEEDSSRKEGGSPYHHDKTRSPGPEDTRRREFEADTGLQRMELRIDHDSGPQMRQGTEGKKHKKSHGGGGGGSPGTATDSTATTTAPPPPSSKEGCYSNSRFLNHLTHYPVLSDALAQLSLHAPTTLVNFIKSHTPHPPDGKNTLPLVGTIDSLADAALTTIDAYFPVLTKPTPELVEDTVGRVRRPVEGVWADWAVPVVGTLTDPLVGRVNDLLVGVFKPKEVVRRERAREKARKRQQHQQGGQQHQQKGQPQHPRNDDSAGEATKDDKPHRPPPGAPGRKTYAEVSVTPPPGGKQQLHQHHHDMHPPTTTDESDTHHPRRRPNHHQQQQQQHPRNIELHRTYTILTSILHDTQHTLRDPHARIYHLPLLGGTIHRAATWAVGKPGPKKKKPTDGYRSGSAGSEHEHETTRQQRRKPEEPEVGGQLDGGESRRKMRFAGVAGAENVTVIGGGREGSVA